VPRRIARFARPSLLRGMSHPTLSSSRPFPRHPRPAGRCRPAGRRQLHVDRAGPRNAGGADDAGDDERVTHRAGGLERGPGNGAASQLPSYRNGWWFVVALRFRVRFRVHEDCIGRAAIGAQKRDQSLAPSHGRNPRHHPHSPAALLAFRLVCKVHGNLSPLWAARGCVPPLNAISSARVPVIKG